MRGEGTAMNPPEADPLGHGVLAARLASIPGYLGGMMASAAGFQARPFAPGESFLVTGIGSSEAHARFLTWELNRLGTVRAEFVPLAAMDSATGFDAAGRTLVLFSQGLSRNVRLVLDQRARFSRTVLFTAATTEGLLKAGQGERAELLNALQSENAEIVRFPLEQEYEILIRVVGPVCGFLAVRLWVDSLRVATGSAPKVESLDAVLSGAEDGLASFLETHATACASGLRILAPPALAQFGQNLVCKAVEGLFWSPPQLLDFLSFAHGPFQQLAARSAPVVILRPTHDAKQAGLADRAVAMCRSIGLPVHVIPLNAPAGWEVLESELRFNRALLPLVRHLGVNQRDWPGRGADAPLYAYP